MDHYLIVKEWSPNFDPLEDKEEKLLVWVRLPGIPIEYFHSGFLEKVAEKIGRLVCINEATCVVAKGKYTRMCVEVDITKPLLPKFKIKGRQKKIEYEGIHLICFHCGIYGHRKESCPSYIAELNLTKQAENSGSKEVQVEAAVVSDPVSKEVPKDPVETEVYGPWMLVTRKPMRVEKGKSKSISMDSGNRASGSAHGRMDGGAFESLRDDSVEPVVVENQGKSKSGIFHSGQASGSSKMAKGRGRRPTVQISEKEVANA